MKNMNDATYGEYSDYRWKLVDGMAYREDGLKLPITTEILEDIKKHVEATKYLEKFLQVPEKEEQMLGYLYAILDDCVNYFNEKQIKELIGKMKNIGQSDWIDMQNVSYIHTFCHSLEGKDNDRFYDALDQFYDYNAPYFQQVLANGAENKFHL